MAVRIKKLHANAMMPERKSSGAAGFDLAACLPAPIYMRSGETYKISTGLALEMTPGLMALIVVRSGCALQGLSVEHPPIDSDYRGEIFIIARWHYCEAHARMTFVVNHGQRIAQLLFLVALDPPMMEVDALDETVRSTNGFGSTGV